MKTEFRQKAKVGVAGSFFNQLMSNNATLPEVGKGATEMLYTDRQVYEVIEVSKDYKTVKLEKLEAKIDPEYLKALKGGDSIGHQNWVFEPTGQFMTVVWKWGSWKVKRKVIRFTKAFKDNATTFALACSLTEEQRQAVYGNDVRPHNVVPGITEEGYEYTTIKLLFGVKDYYYDWSF